VVMEMQCRCASIYTALDTAAYTCKSGLPNIYLQIGSASEAGYGMRCFHLVLLWYIGGEQRCKYKTRTQASEQPTK